MKEARKSFQDDLLEIGLFPIRQEADTAIVLRLAANARSRVSVDLLVVDSNPEDEGKGSLPSIPGGGSPLLGFALVGEPANDLLLRDALHVTRAKLRDESLQFQLKIVGNLGIIAGAAMFESVFAKRLEGELFPGEFR